MINKTCESLRSAHKNVAVADFRFIDCKVLGVLYRLS